MACPFFDPATPFSWEEWPDPPRLPLGDPHHGVCAAGAGPAPETHLRTCCNMGYARGKCDAFLSGPTGSEAPDAVRFGILGREAGVARIRYVIERDHHPFEDGTLEIRESASADETIVARQARAFLGSYLRRNR